MKEDIPGKGLVEALRWRYAVKNFDKNRNIPVADVEYLKEAVRLSVSSYGLQPYKIFVVSGESVKQQLRTASWNQSQLSDASHIFIFCSHDAYKDSLAEDYVRLLNEADPSRCKDPQERIQKIKSRIGTLDTVSFRTWSALQCYIALGTLIAAAAEKGIDTCPIGGFDPVAYDEILGLREKGLASVVACAAGYRSADDPHARDSKIRKSLKELFEETPE